MNEHSEQDVLPRHLDNLHEIRRFLKERAKLGDTRSVLALLDDGIDVHLEEDVALRLSAGRGHDELVEALLDRGADIHARDDAALRDAAEAGRTTTVSLLLCRDADVNARKDAALREALGNGHTETAAVLRRRMNSVTRPSTVVHPVAHQGARP